MSNKFQLNIDGRYKLLYKLSKNYKNVITVINYHLRIFIKLNGISSKRLHCTIRKNHIHIYFSTTSNESSFNLCAFTFTSFHPNLKFQNNFGNQKQIRNMDERENSRDKMKNRKKEIYTQK